MEKKPGNGKSLIDLEPSTDVPLRTLSLTQTTFVGIGTAMGGVMFAIIRRAIAAAGPSILVTLIIGAFFALLIGLSYAARGSRARCRGPRFVLNLAKIEGRDCVTMKTKCGGIISGKNCKAVFRIEALREVVC